MRAEPQHLMGTKNGWIGRKGVWERERERVELKYCLRSNKWRNYRRWAVNWMWKTYRRLAMRRQHMWMNKLSTCFWHVCVCVLCTQWHAPDCVDKHNHTVRERCFTCTARNGTNSIFFRSTDILPFKRKLSNALFPAAVAEPASARQQLGTYFNVERRCRQWRPVKKFCHLNLIFFFSLAAIIFWFIQISAAPTPSSSTQRATQMWNMFWNTLNSDTIPPVVCGIAVKSMNDGEPEHIV